MKKTIFITLWVVLMSPFVCGAGHIEDGLCKVFSGDDQSFLLILETQKQGEREGVSFQFYENGEVEKMSWYDGGKLHGASQGFWADGKAKFLMDYHSGILNGRVQVYDRQGRPQMELSYQHGRAQGEGFYYEEGVLAQTVVYENGAAVKIK